MIINHKYKFIFLKTRKTAGTSIEIALSQFCGANDIITRLHKESEPMRQALGFRGSQNRDVPLRFYSKFDWVKLLLFQKRKRFSNHVSAHFIRENIGEEIWNSYFKFCFERNPFDKAISRYYWSTSEPRPEIYDYLLSARIDLLSNWDIYTVNDHVAVDFVGRYENLTDDLAVVTEKIGIPGQLDLPRAKAGYRKNREHYRNVIDTQSRARIELVCAKEITAFNYSWDDLQNKSG